MLTWSGHANAALRSATALLRPRGPRERVEKLLVLGYGAIGDTLFFWKTLEALRRAHPKARLVWVSNPAPVADELIPASGLADEVWRWEAMVRDELGRAALNARIAAARFDLAVLTLGTPVHEFVAGLSTIPDVAGHVMPWRGAKLFVTSGDYARRALITRRVSAPAAEHAQSRSLRLLDALGIPRPDAAKPPGLPAPQPARRRAAELLDGLGGTLVALHLGLSPNQYFKMWAAERYAELSKRLCSGGKVSVVLVGSGDEGRSEKAFRDAGGVCARSLIGKTGLLETFAVLSRCALAISNDTGVAKSAGALGVPTTTIWGLSDPREVGIPWEPGKHLDVRTGIGCSPCARLGVADKPYNYLNCGHHDCLGRLEVDFAWDALRSRYRDILDK